MQDSSHQSERSAPPLKWEVGDRCVARGEVGTIESIGPGCASVKLNEWRRLFVGLDELELMPLPEETPGNVPLIDRAPAVVDHIQRPDVPPSAAVASCETGSEHAPPATEAFPNEVAEGERGEARLRKKGDPLKKWGIMRRPRLDDIERWYCYRTHVCVSHNAAKEKGAPAEVLAHFAAEHDFAVAHLEKHRPGFIERLHGDKETDEETKATPQAEDAAPVGEQRKVNRTPRRRARADKPGAAGRVQAPQPSHGDTPLPSRPRVALADYSAFVSTKLTRAPSTGLTELPDLHPSLFPFQRDLVSWALRRGRAALFADTGLGKTAMQIEWARHIPGDVLILAPLAVAAQTAREGERLGVPVKVCRDGSDVEPGVNVTNYDRLHRFDPARFTGVVLDESSIIKHHDAKTLANLLAAFADTPFKLCATATPSPNDYTELGTHAEFLGVCSRTEMLAEHFIHDGGDTSKWRLKGHARAAFWRWMSSWAALIRKPSDLGYDDGGYDLPELRITQHTIAADPEQVKSQGLLFAEPARSLTERRAARKSSLSARVERCADVVRAEPNESWVIWCELNAEADALASALTGAVEIRGSDEPILKEGRLVAFGRGEFRILITKPSIAGFGLNWQHAARMAFVGVKDSWESYYQAIRREWRFGQKRPVEVHVFASELEGEVVANLRRKERDALAMAEQLSAETREAVRAEVRGMVRDTNEYAPAKALAVPDWLRREGNAA